MDRDKLDSLHDLTGREIIMCDGKPLPIFG